ncbi:hypothetical protein THAOC_32989, partial [Thalassiosira oceanica]
GPEETSQQASKRRETLRRSINAAKKKGQRVAEKGGEREQVRLQKQALRQDLHRQTETEDARTLRLQGQAMRQDLHRHAETEYAREARLQADRANKESKREAETEDARTLRLQDQAHRQDLLRQTETEDAREPGIKQTDKASELWKAVSKTEQAIATGKDNSIANELNDATTGHKLQLQNSPNGSRTGLTLCLAKCAPSRDCITFDTLDEDDDTLGEVPRALALRLHVQRLKTLERTVLAERAEALSRLDSTHEQAGPIDNDNGKIVISA